MIRTILEKVIQDTVMSFKQLNEQQSGKAARQNNLQNLNKGSDLWKVQIRDDYVDLIGQPKLAQLRVYFQQRHLLSHQQGIEDHD